MRLSTQPGELIVPNMKRASLELKGEPEEIADQIIALIKNPVLRQRYNSGGFNMVIKKILIYGELDKGRLHPVASELLSKAKELFPGGM